MKQRNIAIDTEAIELVAKMIAEKPEARFTPEQVLADKFMQGKTASVQEVHDRFHVLKKQKEEKATADRAQKMDGR